MIRRNFRFLLFVIFALLALDFAFSVAANADTPSGNDVSQALMTGPVVALIIAGLIGTGIPLLTGFITNEKWPSALKFAITGVLSAITGVLSQYLEARNSGLSFAWESAVVTAGVTWASAEAAWVKGWAKTKFGQANASGSALSIGQAPTIPTYHEVLAGVDADVISPSLTPNEAAAPTDSDLTLPLVPNEAVATDSAADIVPNEVSPDDESPKHLAQ